MYLSFNYKEVNYEGYGLEIVSDLKKHIYLFYVDTNILPRFTKLNHLKNTKNLKSADVTIEYIKTNLPSYSTNLNLFTYEGRQVMEELRDKHKETFLNFEKKRDDDENFNLKKYARK